MEVHKRSNRRPAVGLAALLATTGLWLPAKADSGPLPGSCKVHATKVVNPGCVPAATSEMREPGPTYPDLVPDVNELFTYPDDTWDPATQTWIPGPVALRFDTWAQNLGTVPLELITDDPGDLEYDETSMVSQCVAWTATYVCREYSAVGRFEWHEDHRHFHYQDFAKYELRRLAADGRPDYSDAGLVQVSDKVSYCLVDSTWVGLVPTSPLTYPQNCSPTRQGVSPGWSDVYTSELPGQGFSLVDPVDGLYAVVVSLNTSGSLHESDLANNRVEVTIELSGRATTVTVLGKAWQ